MNKKINVKHFNKFLYIINSLILFALLLTYLTPLIDPINFWPISFIGLAYPILLFINLLFLIFWFFSWEKYFWANFIIIFLGVSHVESFIGINEIEINQSVNSIKILSYNVRLFNKNENIKKQDIDNKIIKFIKSYDAQIFCVQEFEKSENTKILEQFFNTKIKDKLKLQIFSVYEEVNYGVIKDNICVYKDLKIDKDTIRVYNMHLQSNWIDSIRSSFQNRSNEVKIIKKHIKSSPYKVILCGDLNDTPISYAYNKISKDMKDSFNKSAKGLGGSHTEIPMLRIDYIFTSKEIESYDYQKHNIKLSDHFPISCKISIP